MSSEDWRVFRAVVLWGSLIGLVYTAMDSRNYAERGRGDSSERSHARSSSADEYGSTGWDDSREEW